MPSRVFPGMPPSGPGFSPRVRLRADLAIDDARVKFREDAIRVSRRRHKGRGIGCYRVEVSIWDVVELVRPNSPLGRLLRSNPTEQGWPEEAHPLPEEIYERGGLMAGRLRLAVTARMFFTAEGILKRFVPFESMVTVREALSFREADRILASPYERLNPKLSLAVELAGLLRARRSHPVTDFDRLREAVAREERLNGNGWQSGTALSARAALEELMNAANAALAAYLLDQQCPFVSRNQIGLTTPAFDALESLGHASLGYAHYLRFTSPRRRRWDYVNLAVLKMLMRGVPLDEIQKYVDSFRSRLTSLPMSLAARPARLAISPVPLAGDPSAVADFLDENQPIFTAAHHILRRMKAWQFSRELKRALESGRKAYVSTWLEVAAGRELSYGALAQLFLHKNRLVEVRNFLGAFFEKKRPLDYGELLDLIFSPEKVVMVVDPPPVLSKKIGPGMRRPSIVYSGRALVLIGGKIYTHRENIRCKSSEAAAHGAAYLFLRDYASEPSASGGRGQSATGGTGNLVLFTGDMVTMLGRLADQLGCGRPQISVDRKNDRWVATGSAGAFNVERKVIAEADTHEGARQACVLQLFRVLSSRSGRRGKTLRNS
jgi:hypothetical protein